MKTALRLLPLFLAFALAMSACATQIPETAPEFDFDFSGETDFEGRNFTVMQEKIGDDDVIYFYEPDSLYYDLFIAHVNKIEKQNNLKLTFSKSMGSESTFSNAVFSSYVAGINICDYVIMRGSNLNMVTARSGAFYPLNYFPDIIDLHNSEKYGPVNILECCMANGNIYGVIPAYWPLRTNDGNLGVFVCINENFITRYGLDDPRDMYEQNEWKLSKFEEIMPRYHIADGANDIKALGMNTRYLARGFMGSYQIGNVYEKDGQYYSAEHNPDLIEALEWGVNFVNSYSDDYILLDGWDYSDHLANGVSTMVFSESSYLLNVASKVDNFGIVPFPVADKYDCKDIKMGFSTYPTFSMFAGADDPDACAMLIDILFEQIEGADKENMVDFLFRTMFFDERDARLYTEVYKNGVYDYFGVGGNLQQKIETVYTIKTPQEVVASVTGTLDRIFEEQMLENYLTMQEYAK
ncbi:MAG: hypothetical protein J5816_02415 [Clostridia bacterium]|nr:hypothetical protein [Clostridia bacterium]